VTAIFILCCWLCYCKKQCEIYNRPVETVYSNANPANVYATERRNYPTNPTVFQLNQTNLGYIDSNTNVCLNRQFSLPTYDEAIKSPSTKIETA
jgi:hypothetical protein